MSDVRKVAVIGAGSFGTALSHLFSDSGCEVRIWARNKKVVDSINKTHKNPNSFSQFTLPKTIEASTDLASVIEFAEFLVCAIPTQSIREVFSPHASQLSNKLIVNTSKGIEQGTLYRVSQIFYELSGNSPYVILSGPSFAEEIIKRLPTAVTVAGKFELHTMMVQNIVSTPYFRAYTTEDVTGVELGGALKNVIAIACGIATGLGLGSNAQAALINRGMKEMIKLGQSEGALTETFFGLSGMGDLVLTCTGALSRNRRFGMGFGQGKSIAVVEKELGEVAEGYHTAKSAYDLTKKLNLDLPIVQEIYSILYEGKSAEQALRDLMGRELKRRVGLTEIAILSLAGFLTSIVSATIGVIGGTLLLSVMTLFLSPVVLIPIHGVVQLTSNATRAFLLWKWIDKNLFASLAVGALIGSLAGSRVLITLPEDLFRIILGIFLLIMTWLPLKKANPTEIKTKPSKVIFFLLGLVVSFLSLFIGAVGPLLAPIILRANLGKEGLIGTQAACQVLLHLLKILVFGWIGFNYWEYAPLLLAMVLSVVVGTFVGKKLLIKFPEKKFMMVFRIVLTLLACRLLWQGLNYGG